MFTNQNTLLLDNPTQLNYGIAVADINHDGTFEVFVAGFGFPNLVLKWNGQGFVNIVDEQLADSEQQAIGVAAGDIDGDGREELYVLNTDTFGGRKNVGDRLFDFRDEQWTDLFSLSEYQEVQNLTAGRSVVTLDRYGTGQYGFFVANYGGPMRLYEFTPEGQLYDVAPQAELNFVTGGRGVVALPLVSEQMDIFAANERGSNFLFRNNGDGTFSEVAQQSGINDRFEHGRGVAVLDANGSGFFDLAYGNWEGTHRLFIQTAQGQFIDQAPPAMATPSRIRTVIAADFDNDGYEEIFFNNIGEPNRLFGQRDGVWVPLAMGDADEPNGLGTGAAVGDFDSDGRLELIIAHGETDAQPLTLYHTPETNNAWLRVLPFTEQGAPARGATVTLHAGGRTQRRAIDAGSGYLCQMEPVAHFGLGTLEHIDRVEVRWLDGATVTIDAPQTHQLIRVAHP